MTQKTDKPENQHHTYPSTGQFKNVIKDVTKAFRSHKIFDFPPLTFIGTVKLHGTNASIYSDLSKNNFVVQSKNNVITVDKDNYGFAQAITPIKEQFIPLFEKIKEVLGDYENKTAVIYGEWCGANIQPTVALAQLDNMFVAFGIKILQGKEEKWLSYNQFNEVMNINQAVLQEHKVFNIYDFPTWKIDIDFNNPQIVQNKLVDITMEVEKECPVAKKFGISGIGEGVVWKNITHHPAIESLHLFFKVKGKEHSVSHVTSLAMVDTEKVKNIAEFVEKVVTENRLKQGLEYLKEQHLSLTEENIKTFISWVVKDCFKEEKDMITESNLQEKEVAQSIAFKAKDWFLSKTDSKNKLKM